MTPTPQKTLKIYGHYSGEWEAGVPDLTITLDIPMLVDKADKKKWVKKFNKLLATMLNGDEPEHTWTNHDCPDCMCELDDNGKCTERTGWCPSSPMYSERRV